MLASRLRVAVIGCGSAGPAAALLLARAGHTVEIFERAREFLPVGTGFLLQPTGQWVLKQLGLFELAASHGARVARLRSLTAGGRVLLNIDYAGLGPGSFGLGMHRATLLQLLVDALEGQGVVIHLGSEIESGELAGDQRWLFGNGTRHGPFDLVIVANGARSRARDWICRPSRARTYPWGALWTIVPDHEGRFSQELYQVVEGTQTMVGLLGTGTRADDASATPLVSLFWSVRNDRVAEVRHRGASELAGEIIRLVPAAEEVLSRVEAMEQWSYAEYLDVVMPRWHGDRCVVLGDAGHAMSPQLGQGVNLALFDAWVLAECIGTGERLPAALARYSQMRRAHLRYYQFATRWLTPLFQSSLTPLGWARDIVFPQIAAVPPLKRQMLRTMAGLKRGILRRSLSLGPTPLSRQDAGEKGTGRRQGGG